MMYDFVCTDDYDDEIVVEAETYNDAIRKLFANNVQSVRKAHGAGFKVVSEGVTYLIKRGDKL